MRLIRELQDRLSLIPLAIQFFGGKALDHLRALLPARLRALSFRHPKPSQPSEAPKLGTLFCCSVIYLAFELSFAAQLLDLAGTHITTDQLESLEIAGRLLSGTALALFALSFYLRKPRKLLARAVLIPLITGLCIAAMWALQHRIVETSIRRFDPADRQHSALVVRTVELARKGHVLIPGLDLSADVLAAPEGLALMAVLPAIMFQDASLPARLEPVMANAITRDLALSCDGRACVGEFEDFHQHWPELSAAWASAYEAYDKARKAVSHPDPALIREEADKAWQDYTKKAGDRIHTDNILMQSSIRGQLRARGLPVSDRWKPDDRTGFDAAVRQKIINKAKENYSFVAKLLSGGESLPDDLSADAFYGRADVANTLWRQQLSDYRDLKPFNPPGLNPERDDEASLRRSHAGIIRFLRAVELDAYYGDPAQFDKQQVLGWSGRVAAQMIVVPPLALAFSILGAIAHMAKVLGYLAGAISRNRRAGRAAAFGFAALAIAACLMLSNSITASEAYQRLNQKMSEQQGPALATGMAFIIQAEGLLYPLNNAIRQHLLRGIDYTEL